AVLYYALHFLLQPLYRSTLFPYTTLFRSYLPNLCTKQLRIDFGQQLALFHARIEVGEHAHDTARDLCADLHLSERFESASGLDQDRKSTRLNSSHVKISYAVFCLKKKNRK